MAGRLPPHAVSVGELAGGHLDQLLGPPRAPTPPKGWTSAKVGTLAEDLASRALTQIGVTDGPETPGDRDFQDHGRSPHGLYRALILAHGEPVTLPRKYGFTREYDHATSLLIMVCF
jgi:hypothetical protein